MLIQGFKLTIILHIYINQCASNKRGYCFSSTRRSKSDEKFHCCDFFEDVNNTCTECKDGYSSFSGSPCQPCTSGLHGRRCVELCNCKENERCDHIEGCLKLTTYEEGFYKDITGISSMQLTITQSATANNDTSHRDKEIMQIQPILIYIICAGCVTILVMTNSAIMIYRKKRQPEKSKESLRVINKEQHQIENIETDHYLTVV